MSHSWDASTYDRVSGPQVRWAGPVLDRLALRGDERVLDAGCGTGRVTEQLLQRLPRGSVVALDASAAMLQEAGRRLGAGAARVELVQADLSGPLPVSPPVDAVVSTATLHWVTDHDALFRHLAEVMRPGAPLVAQCGGRGNIEGVVAALRRVGDGWEGPWRFAGAEETRDRLLAAGFVDVETWLHDEPVPFDSAADLRDFLRTAVLVAHLERLPGGECDAFVDDVVALLPQRRLDYVRLNIVARRGPD